MSNAKPLPPIEVLREFFRYEPETGFVYRLKKSARCHAVGERVGHIQSARGRQTYLITSFRYQRIKVHRLAWKLHTGEEPPTMIDHANGDYTDNRWENLRAATQSQNATNWRRRGKHLPGTQLRPSGKWAAYGSLPGSRSVHLGTFESESEAHQAHIQWSLDTFGEFSLYS